MSLLGSLLAVSEKAADIARLCRQNPHLFRLLIQEKGRDESNPRFVEDFKTLADVLIQETVRHDVGTKFPEIADRILGEENNVFENKLGERITVEVLENAEATSNLLRRVLNDDEEAAMLLAEVVHAEICITDAHSSGELPRIDDCKDLAIWIDPIDSTAEYINGVARSSATDICVNGLSCVTVLIGAFDGKTGRPIVGIVNQPFFRQENQRWTGRRFWSCNDRNSLGRIPTVTNRVCLSSTEEPTIKTRLESAGFELVEAAGAGYKSLLVILGTVDAYILSKSSTFKWDTCAPQALLSSMGGGLIDYREARGGRIVPISYDIVSYSKSRLDKCCNDGGIIAYRDERVLDKILRALREN